MWALKVDTAWAIFLLVVFVLYLLTVFIFATVSGGKEVPKLQDEILRLKVENEALEANSMKKAVQMFQNYKDRDMAVLRSEITELAKKEAEHNLATWKAKYTAEIRANAINQSGAVILGKVTEHLVPYISADFKFNPKEARFIGSPVDMIVFEGIDDEREASIHILEIKTGDAVMNKRQRLIKEAIEAKRVHWRDISLKKF